MDSSWSVSSILDLAFNRKSRVFDLIKTPMSELAESSRRNRSFSAPTWLKFAGAAFSIATFASLVTVYIARQLKILNRAKYSSAIRAKARTELEETWKSVYQTLGELAFSKTIPLGISTQYSVGTFRSNTPNEDHSTQFVYSDSSASVRAIFGVFDGHSTRSASLFASEELPGFIERRLRVLDLQERRLLQTLNTAHHNSSNGQMPTLTPYEQTAVLSRFASERPNLIKEALIAAFLDADRFFLAESILLYLLNGGQAHSGRASLDRCFSGTCAIITLIDRGFLYCANAGDCRAVLGVEVPGEPGKPNVLISSVLSNDHNTDNPREVRRIQAMHSKEKDPIFVNGRVKGILKPTRGIGDALLKEPIARRFIKSDVLNSTWEPPYTTAIPEVSYRQLGPNDKFIVIGSDGLWDLITSIEAVHLVSEYDNLRKEGKIPPDINVCTFIIERALARAEIPADLCINTDDTQKPNNTSDTPPASSSKSDITPSTSNSNSPSPLLAPSPNITISRPPKKISSNAPNNESADFDLEKEVEDELRRLTTVLSLPANLKREVYDDISVTVIWLDTGRREQVGSAMAALGSWECPSFPAAIERVNKLKKAIPQSKPLNRLLASGNSDAVLLKAYIEQCAPERYLDKWTTQEQSTRDFLQSYGIDARKSTPSEQSQLPPNKSETTSSFKPS